MAEIVLVLFILSLGTTFGAGLYETRIVVPQWFQKLSAANYRVNTQVMLELDSGRKFWAFVTTGPLTLITLANLVVAWQSEPPKQGWWFAATVIILVERIGTFAFFIPTAIKLQKADTLPSEYVSRLASSWIIANHIRSFLTLVGWLFALKAFSLGV
jgi:uncharacterized membrane protein